MLEKALNASSPFQRQWLAASGQSTAKGAGVAEEPASEARQRRQRRDHFACASEASAQLVTPLSQAGSLGVELRTKSS